MDVIQMYIKKSFRYLKGIRVKSGISKHDEWNPLPNEQRD